MAELKTKPTGASAAAFIEAIEDETRRADCLTMLRLMKKLTRKQAKMWGQSIVGFGDYRYRYASGREGDWFQVGFSPRKDALTIYLMSGLHGREAFLEKLGKHKTGKGCLYVKRLADIDLSVLEKLIAASVKQTERKQA